MPPRHADQVVRLLSAALAARNPGLDADTVLKLTGAADRPLDLIGRYKNERLPSIAVTVDLLTTGVDVPAICNLVFLRRVNSRILFEQMLGRATRPCPAVGKEAFRIYDAVQVYAALQAVTDMQPVVQDVTIPFTQLTQELATVTGDAERQLVLEQFIARLRRKQRTLSAQASEDFETRAGMPPDQFIAHRRELPLDAVAAWFSHNLELGELLDQLYLGSAPPVPISLHDDYLDVVSRGYGRGERPEDYLNTLRTFILGDRDRIPALVTVLTRPQALTRQELRALALVLEEQHFSETALEIAWREARHEEIAAHLIGYIRALALDEPLLAYDVRVERAKQKLLQSRAWTQPQRDWLNRIAAQTKANQIVDRAALDDPNQLFRRDGGGFERLNRLFDNALEQVLGEFNAAIWDDGQRMGFANGIN